VPVTISPKLLARLDISAGSVRSMFLPPQGHACGSIRGCSQERRLLWNRGSEIIAACFSDDMDVVTRRPNLMRRSFPPVEIKLARDVVV
jgi:hypothetical protein